MGLSSTVVSPTAALIVGQYLSILKAVPFVIVLLIWTRLLTWVDKDAEEARLPRQLLNAGLMAGLVASYALLLVLPTFIIGLLVVIVGIGIDAAVYLSLRQRSVGLGDLSIEFKNWLNGIFGKEKVVKEIAGAVQLYGADGLLMPAPEADAPEAEAFTAIQSLLTPPMENGAQLVELVPSESGLTARYSLDGIVYPGATVTRASGNAATLYLKEAAGMDTQEVRKPQTGTLKVNVNKQKRELQLTTRGTTAGETARLLSEPKKRHSFTLDALGMLDDQVEELKAARGSGGIVLLSTPKGQGLTSLSYAILRSHDAFLEHLMSVERDQEQDLEGVTQQPVAANATPEEELKQVSWIVSQQPDVLLVSKPQNAKTARELMLVAQAGKTVYVAVAAGDVNETIAAWRKLVGDDKAALSHLKMVISGRLLRRLCPACKQGYTPDPQTLRKLGIDPSRVSELYQALKEPPLDPKGNPIHCEFCNDIRYKGRIGIYEMLMIDDEVRAILLSGGTPAQLKSAFRKQKGRYLQELGLVQVERGETSVQEVLRALKPENTSKQKKPAA